MIQLLMWGVVAAAVAIGVWGLYSSVKRAGYNEAKLECQQAAEDERTRRHQQAHTAGSILEAEDGKAKVVYRTITKAVDRYIDRPVYRNVCLDADGLRDANAGLRGGKAAAAEPDKPLPRPDGAK